MLRASRAFFTTTTTTNYFPGKWWQYFVINPDVFVIAKNSKSLLIKRSCVFLFLRAVNMNTPPRRKKAKGKKYRTPNNEYRMMK